VAAFDLAPCFSAFIATRRFPVFVLAPVLRSQGCVRRMVARSERSPSDVNLYGRRLTAGFNASLFAVFFSMSLPVLDNLLPRHVCLPD
jgi:hypothetical protein